MGKIIRLIALILFSSFLLIIVYCIIRAISGFNQGYSWKEMDWNEDGRTSIGEFFDASEIGKRDIFMNGKKCIEYYAYKDGISVKASCAKTGKKK